MGILVQLVVSVLLLTTVGSENTNNDPYIYCKQLGSKDGRKMDVAQSQPKIPEMLFYIQGDKKDDLKQAHGCLKLNPQYRGCTFNAQSIDRFVKSEYPDLYVGFSSLPKIAEQYDVARYLILHRYGGVYLDLDFMCLHPISNVLEPNDTLIVGTETDVATVQAALQLEYFMLHQIHQWAILSAPGHPVLLAAATSAVNSATTLFASDPTHDSMLRTGSALWTSTIQNYITNTTMQHQNSAPWNGQVKVLPVTGFGGQDGSVRYIISDQDRLVQVAKELPHWPQVVGRHLFEGTKDENSSKRYLDWRKQKLGKAPRQFALPASLMSSYYLYTMSFKSEGLWVHLAVPPGAYGLSQNMVPMTSFVFMFGAWNGGQAASTYGRPILSQLIVKILKSLQLGGLEAADSCSWADWNCGPGHNNTKSTGSGDEQNKIQNYGMQVQFVDVDNSIGDLSGTVALHGYNTTLLTSSGLTHSAFTATLAYNNFASYNSSAGVDSKFSVDPPSLPTKALEPSAPLFSMQPGSNTRVQTWRFWWDSRTEGVHYQTLPSSPPPRAPQKVKCPKHCTANAWMQVEQVKWGQRLKRHSGLKNAGMHEDHPLWKKECANVCQTSLADEEYDDQLVWGEGEAGPMRKQVKELMGNLGLDLEGKTTEKKYYGRVTEVTYPINYNASAALQIPESKPDEGKSKDSQGSSWEDVTEEAMKAALTKSVPKKPRPPGNLAEAQPGETQLRKIFDEARLNVVHLNYEYGSLGLWSALVGTMVGGRGAPPAVVVLDLPLEIVKVEGVQGGMWLVDKFAEVYEYAVVYGWLCEGMGEVEGMEVEGGLFGVGCAVGRAGWEKLVEWAGSEATWKVGHVDMVSVALFREGVYGRLADMAAE